MSRHETLVMVSSHFNSEIGPAPKGYGSHAHLRVRTYHRGVGWFLVEREPDPNYEGRHRRPRPDDMVDGMVYRSDPAERWMVALEHSRDIALEDR